MMALTPKHEGAN